METQTKRANQPSSADPRVAGRGYIRRAVLQWVASAAVVVGLFSGLAHVRAHAANLENGSGTMSVSGTADTLTRASLPDEGPLPSLSGASQWLNSAPLTPESLRGKVVVLNVWTYSCINSLRALPYVNSWARKYKDQGLVVIGVHAPEFEFEHQGDNVKQALHDLGIDYPNVLDNRFSIWRGLGNEYWPALYFVDAQGHIRHHSFGEGDYAQSEQVVRELLAQAGHPEVAKIPAGLGNTPVPGVEAAPDFANLRSPETYFGYTQAENFASPGGQQFDIPYTYLAPEHIGLNHWGLGGVWQVSKDRATLDGATGRVVYRFHARDLHIVLGASGNKPVRFRVTIDGAAPGDAHGVDVAPDGTGVVTEHRLYQLVRQSNGVSDHTFAIEFLDPGVEAYSFTFG